MVGRLVTEKADSERSEKVSMMQIRIRLEVLTTKHKVLTRFSIIHHSRS